MYYSHIHLMIGYYRNEGLSPMEPFLQPHCLQDRILGLVSDI